MKEYRIELSAIGEPVFTIYLLADSKWSAFHDAIDIARCCGSAEVVVEGVYFDG